MFVVIGPERGQEERYEFVEKVTKVAELEQDKQYIFVQEEDCIVIWKVVETIGGPSDLHNAINDLNEYYKKHYSRAFDLMIKKLLSL